MINFEEFKRELLYQEPTIEFMTAVDDMIRCDGLLNLVEKDLNSIRNSGNSMVYGTGAGTGANGLNNAVSDALPKDMVAKSAFTKASSILIYMEAGESYSLQNMGEAFDIICRDCPADIDIVFGLSCDKSSTTNECQVVIITNGWLSPKEDIK